MTSEELAWEEAVERLAHTMCVYTTTSREGARELLGDEALAMLEGYGWMAAPQDSPESGDWSEIVGAWCPRPLFCCGHQLWDGTGCPFVALGEVAQWGCPTCGRSRQPRALVIEPYADGAVDVDALRGKVALLRYPEEEL